jgi:hypothetical protein
MDKQVKNTMNRKQLLDNIQKYDINVDKKTREFIETRLDEISHSIDSFGNSSYNLQSFTPYGKRGYKGNKVYEVYISILEIKAEVEAEAEDFKNNQEEYSRLSSIFHCVGKSGLV